MSQKLDFHKAKAMATANKTRRDESRYGDPRKRELQKEADYLLKQAGFLKGGKCY